MTYFTTAHLLTGLSAMILAWISHVPIMSRGPASEYCHVEGHAFTVGLPGTFHIQTTGLQAKTLVATVILRISRRTRIQW